MQDMEFTVQEGKLWFLQTRNGKRTGTAMVKIAMDLVREGVISEKEAIMRCEPQKLDELLHPVFDKDALKKAKVITQGLPASPGAACGQIVFNAEDAKAWKAKGPFLRRKPIALLQPMRRKSTSTRSPFPWKRSISSKKR